MFSAIISGGSKGIGLETAKAFASAACNVAICARDKDKLQQAAAEIRAVNSSAEVFTFACDVREKSQLQAFTDECVSRFKQINILVNNAGIFIPGELHNEDEGVFENLIATNLSSAYHLSRMVLPHMPNRANSHIFNICSTASIIAYPNGGSYCISKFALYGFSKVLREELKNQGIRVTSVLPGATLTDSWAGTDLPEERFLPPSDVAAAILSCWKMHPSTVVEELLIRPMLGDIT
jgi:short-subunit dehydrogenase